MANTLTRPGRTLAVFFLVVAFVFALVAIGGSWKPQLGLDLQGGTRIMMIAEGNPSGDSLDEARQIIAQRVNGSGVTAAKVTTQGSNVITVEIPGEDRQDLVDKVSQTAELRFRLVACQQTCTVAPAADDASSDTTSSDTASDEASADPSASASADPAASASPSASESGSAEVAGDPSQDYSVADAVAFMSAPSQSSYDAFNAFSCPADGSALEVDDEPGEPLVTCDDSGIRYLLTPAIIEGTQLTDADYGIPQNGVSYVVTLDFNGEGRSAFADATGYISGTGDLFAITLDGQVISAATASSRITGSAQISGSFTQEEASALANNLKYGALPIAFDSQSGISVTTIGPSLAGNQLSAGLWAGGIGLLVVMIYCLFYYRGLGLVVIGSLAVAAGLTYGLVLLLSSGADFAIDLPGIAGLIVAVGITADSFIVYFERIRDEMREGRSMRVAVDTAWPRARNTTLVADAVQLLAAITLYLAAAGDVRGFAFALGLSTLVDLVIFFYFTHPMVKWLAGFKFYNRGHALSGLSREALGLEEARA